MAGIRDLERLLEGMKPEVTEGEFVFSTVFGIQSEKLREKSLLVFREKEGVTLILERRVADDNSLSYSGSWAMVTVTIHSDLSAVGFLARITDKRSRSGISTNVVSAYYHDYLFVPYGLASEAMKALDELSRK